MLQYVLCKDFPIAITAHTCVDEINLKTRVNCHRGFCICRMVETVVAELGGLHIAVNNAGINKNSAAEDTTEQDWDLTFDVNTKGVFLCCQVQPLFSAETCK